MLLPAAPDAPEGDVSHRPGEGLRYAVRDGAFCIWAPRQWQTQEEGMGDMNRLVEQALSLGRETGLMAS